MKKHFLFSIMFFFSINCNCQDAHKRESPDDEKPYLVVEKNAEYPGGHAALYKFISDNIRYPQDAIKKNIQGKVYIRFVIDAKGKVSRVKVIRKVYPSLDKEAMRVIKMMPLWIPAMNEGKNVAVYYTIPMQFVLSKKDQEKQPLSNQ